MSNRNPYKAYQNTQVLTAKPDKILLMLYEGAIRFCKLAQVKMKENDIAEKGRLISKTISIISELMNTLDHNVGGQISMNLESLYMFMIDRLIDGNMHNKVENLQQVEKLLTTLYTAWQDVVNNPREDGIPSAQLQPELHQEYMQAKSSNNNAKPQSAAPQPAVPNAAQGNNRAQNLNSLNNNFSNSGVRLGAPRKP